MLNINQFKTELANRLLLINNILYDFDDSDEFNTDEYSVPYTYHIEEGDIDSFFDNITEITFREDFFLFRFCNGL